jgi:ketosteroid isomerase-like protein
MRVPLRGPSRTSARVWLYILSATLVSTAGLFAQEKSTASNDEIQIRQLERAWNQAEAHHDVGAVTAIVADTLTYIDFDGSIMNKAEYLRDVTKTAYQADHLYDEGLKVVVYGKAAVVSGIYRETGTNKGKNYIHRVRFTDTWIKQNGVWRCAASQNTLIPSK